MILSGDVNDDTAMLSRRPKQALFATGCKVPIRRDLIERGGTSKGTDVLVVSYPVAKSN
ncbi:MAG: hypothetical protein OEY86_19775 [Nitrospira sp.]|nr:hypothetical protein [Nitrospira sp.]